MIYEYVEKDNEGNVIQKICCDNDLELLRMVLVYRHRNRYIKQEVDEE